MPLHQHGRDLGQVIRNPNLLWFTVAPYTAVNVEEAELVGDTTERITILDYHRCVQVEAAAGDDRA
jgi:hypothetical protein